MKNEVNKQQLKEYNDVARRVHKAGTSAPVLSRVQKKHMLAAIVPQQSMWQRFHMSTVAFASFLVVFSSVVIAMSQPGDYLYALKRTLEDARSTVQPSYDNVLLNRRNEEIEGLKNSGAPEEYIEQAENEKQEIESRQKNRSGENGKDNESEDSGNDSPSDTTPNNRSKNNRNETEEETKQSESGSVQNNEQSTKDQCRAALDARKKAGENINSDQYKECDD